MAALQRRAPHLPVVLYPTPVQGDAAAPQIAAAIAMAGARADVDVLIVARGGGSIEDLWAFNEEIVARAIAASPLPVISGVGHETDITISDFAADQRAATPTAAAEMASAGWFSAAREVATLSADLRNAMRKGLQAHMQTTDLLSRRLLHPGERLARHRQHLAHLQTRLAAAAGRKLRSDENRLADLHLRFSRARPDPAPWRARLALAAQRLRSGMGGTLAANTLAVGRIKGSLAALNPEATLARGYSIVRDAEGRVVIDSNQLRPGDNVDLRFARGRAGGRIETTE
jgi:exodeoxyribonuclease VII large subunit